MSVFHSPSVVVGTLVLLASLLPTATHGHVQLAYPPAIIDDDYQYTFDGSCQKESCDAFCGRAGPDPIFVTSIVPGKLALKLNVNVKHPPFRYRVALSSASDALPGFDTNILLDDIEAPGDGSTEFEVTVDIPGDVNCSPFCTLQLFDYYYFVSCARIVIGDPDTSGVTETQQIAVELMILLIVELAPAVVPCRSMMFHQRSHSAKNQPMTVSLWSMRRLSSQTNPGLALHYHRRVL